MYYVHKVWHRKGLISKIMSLVQLNMYTMDVSNNAHVYFYAT